jgi:tRNA-(ms[2]io[6]A)-hydroxylase
MALLAAPTPSEWFGAAVQRLPELLLDHANCEKKAASTAIALMFAYPDDVALARALSRLAREELRHFEQVDALLSALGVERVHAAPGRYAAGLRGASRRTEPGRKLDLLLTGALIEARSCERFERLAQVLPAQVATLYSGLMAAEARHTDLYLRLAEATAGAAGLRDWRERLTELAAVEAGLATAPDPLFRFHSGPPPP